MIDSGNATATIVIADDTAGDCGGAPESPHPAVTSGVAGATNLVAGQAGAVNLVCGQ